MTNFQNLARLGWTPFFQQQLTLEEWSNAGPARVLSVHRSCISVQSEAGSYSLALTPAMDALTVGDWILMDSQQRYIRLLERQSCFRRKAPGTHMEWQLISANVDTAFILCSLNEDFNLSRLERYLALVNSSSAQAVILLTKSDQVESADQTLDAVRQLDTSLDVLALNAQAPECAERLSPWLTEGQTVVLLGSSGVGKSTLTNTLMKAQHQRTGRIREDDGKGRHTTTHRTLVTLPSGGLLLDTPGMRELQLGGCDTGISAAFSDIELLATQCRFSDCQHNQEPECAVHRAIASGALTQRRLNNYLKLNRENAFNTSTMAQRRAKEKSFGKMVKQTVKDKARFKDR
ncbi:ribosome small subunit-dependent GTPase A [Pseudoalteromonas sp. OOF1S-7]|uniref:ribosome small subunit-dependent GTPase A n=1 Tax=Pseudoalteromonas sp. OOF1S-7 TaxID=2917757 RepID=UPI001EF74A87|nr:ribosome small subunit-dependent GTPase A [Pseudoalteromonas sp. OOF1S-7]MCG7536090.1 ribosome small subunit-dependent GTPase A [Pseudoalteromonas sp. OOF1S-7]